MKLKEIQELLDYVANSELDEVNIETDNFKIAVKKNSGKVVVSETVQSAPQVSAAPALAQQAAPANKAEDASAGKNDNLVEIKSPMIGTFYTKPNPESPNFVSVGDTVKKGQTVCIIEAMKLFNEIESDVKGKIVKVLVEDSTPVEYDQPLFLVELS